MSNEMIQYDPSDHHWVAFDTETTVRAMAMLERDWEWSGYLDTMHPEYHSKNPAAKGRDFNCDKYSDAGWDKYWDRLKALCDYLEINADVTYAQTYKCRSDIYAMRGAIVRAMFNKVRQRRPPRPFLLEDQHYRMDVKDSVLYVYYKNDKYYYYIEMPNGIDYKSDEPYGSSFKALSASVERLLNMPNRYGVET